MSHIDNESNMQIQFSPFSDSVECSRFRLILTRENAHPLISNMAYTFVVVQCLKNKWYSFIFHSLISSWLYPQPGINIFSLGNICFVQLVGKTNTCLRHIIYDVYSVCSRQSFVFVIISFSAHRNVLYQGNKHIEREKPFRIEVRESYVSIHSFSSVLLCSILLF